MHHHPIKGGNIYQKIPATTPLIAPSSDTGGKLGDIALWFKFQIFDAEKTSSGLGLALVPQVDIPSGNNSKFIGDKTVSGSIRAVGDWQIKSNRFYLNAGYKFKDREVIGNNFLVVDDELLYGVGFQRPLVKKWDLDIIAELFGSSSYASNPRTEHRYPLEAIGLLQKRWFTNKTLVTTLGAGGGFTDGYGTPRYRIIFGMSYVHPEKKPAPPPEPVREKIEILDKIHFEFDRAVIQKKSYHVLDDVAAVLMANPDIKKVQVEGHTDSKGSDAYNQKLSERRSQAVVEYLVGKGIERDRLVPIGYGESKPIDTNDTNRGRAMNRRTEFYIVERGE